MIMMGAMDNLVKGAAGQAVQNMNLMFGFAENEGLQGVPMFRINTGERIDEHMMKIIDGGVTAAKGFKAAGMHAGIKKGTKKDMAMIVQQCTM